MTGRPAATDGFSGVHKQREATSRKKLSLKRRPIGAVKSDIHQSKAFNDGHSDGGKENCHCPTHHSTSHTTCTADKDCTVSQYHKPCNKGGTLTTAYVSHEANEAVPGSPPNSPGSPSLLASQYVYGRHESETDGDGVILGSEDEDSADESLRKYRTSAGKSKREANGKIHTDTVGSDADVKKRVSSQSGSGSGGDSERSDTVRVRKRRGRKERTLARVRVADRDTELLNNDRDSATTVRAGCSSTATGGVPPVRQEEESRRAAAETLCEGIESDATNNVLETETNNELAGTSVHTHPSPSNTTGTEQHDSARTTQPDVTGAKSRDRHGKAYTYGHDRSMLVELILKELAEREGFAHFACSTHGTCVEVQLPVLRIERLHYTMPCQADQKLWCARSIPACEETAWAAKGANVDDPLSTIEHTAMAPYKKEDLAREYTETVAQSGVDMVDDDRKGLHPQVTTTTLTCTTSATAEKDGSREKPDLEAKSQSSVKSEGLPESLADTHAVLSKGNDSDSNSMPPAMQLSQILRVKQQSPEPTTARAGKGCENVARTEHRQGRESPLLNAAKVTIQDHQERVAEENGPVHASEGECGAVGRRSGSRSCTKKTPMRPGPMRGVKQRSTTAVIDLELQTPRSQRLKRRRMADRGRARSYTPTPVLGLVAPGEALKQESAVTFLSAKKATRARGSSAQNTHTPQRQRHPQQPATGQDLSVIEDIESYPNTDTGTPHPRTLARTCTNSPELARVHLGTQTRAPPNALVAMEGDEMSPQPVRPESRRCEHTVNTLAQSAAMGMEGYDNSVDDDSQWDQVAQSVVKPVAVDTTDYLHLGQGASLNTQALYDMIREEAESPLKETVNADTGANTQDMKESVKNNADMVHSLPVAVACPLCYKRFSSREIQSHAASCDGSADDDRKTTSQKGGERHSVNCANSPVVAIDIDNDESPGTAPTSDAYARASTYAIPHVLTAVDSSHDLPTQSDQWIKPNSKRAGRNGQKAEHNKAPLVRPNIKVIYPGRAKQMGSKSNQTIKEMFGKLEDGASRPNRPYAAAILSSVALSSKGPTHAEVRGIASRISGKGAASRSDTHAGATGTGLFKQPIRPTLTHRESYRVQDDSNKSIARDSSSHGAHRSTVEPQQKTRRSNRATNSTAQVASLGLDAICERTPGRRSHQQKKQGPISVDSDSNDSLDEILSNMTKSQRTRQQTDDVTSIPATHIHSTSVRFDDEDNDASDPLRDPDPGKTGYLTETYDPDNMIDEALFANMSPIKGFVPLAEPHSQFLADQFGNSRVGAKGVPAKATGSRSQTRRRPATKKASGRARGSGGWNYRRKKK
ncbi:hypothetical protein, variant [Sphaeroforma arctica JP610]|uniref:Uncharacterized protein n=1 Tax=Sphaeroforma arctica JP610 TaxID=667725 RepID=A0A0L0G5G1_9EUKA|nr:hypothetical protein, variant [Sphaeroforma arctica JP610]KNC83493.1 hypothetical protein, variant [Sphaeroforma arctica JP610]|eukprot:XP_014157395.1 hypothetical protein, variant [Sphaeroforma arctica JP610]